MATGRWASIIEEMEGGGSGSCSTLDLEPYRASHVIKVAFFHCCLPDELLAGRIYRCRSLDTIDLVVMQPVGV